MNNPPLSPEPPLSPDGTVLDDSSSAHLISVQIDPAFAALLDADRLHRLATYVLAAEAVEAAVELGISVTTDAEIHALNRQYLGHDYPTDVISFTSEEEGETPDAVRLLHEEGQGLHPTEEPVAANFQFVGPPGWPEYLGDIVISYETAAAQAPDYSHAPAAEVDVLLTHGILHLLGYDDQSDADHAQMHARQDALVAAFTAEEERADGSRG
jgi:probable rRNA maturation factor